MKQKNALKLISIVLASAITSTAVASSHREAPYITKDPQVDGTDLYAVSYTHLRAHETRGNLV